MSKQSYTELHEPEQIRKILSGKKILFVEDRIEQIKPFVLRLTRKFKDDTGNIIDAYLSQENIATVHSLEKALSYLKNEENIADFIFIDLNIAPVPVELQEWRATYFRERELNHGQLLGMWLRHHNTRKHTPYAYLSALLEHLDLMVEPDEPSNVLALGKNFPAKRFPGWLAGVLQSRIS